MKKITAKALYLYLCSILGMVLFAMLHRAVFVLYDLLLVIDFEAYSFGMSSATILTLDFTTMLIVILLGGWYGIALGIEWYSMVYGPNAEKPAGLFHGFIPHNWRGKRSAVRKQKQPAPAVHTETTHFRASVPESRSWNLEDLVAAKNAARKPVRKSAAKPAGKTVAKKTVRKSK